MTPTERAELLYDSLAGADAWDVAGPLSRSSAVAELAAAVREAVAAERERCALVALRVVDGEDPQGWRVADAIREGT